MTNKNVPYRFSSIFVRENVYFICCCNITNNVISLVAHKLHEIHMVSRLLTPRKIAPCLG